MDKLVKNYLFRCESFPIYQDPEMFSFSLDTVLLANFTKPKNKDVICDFGTNNAAIPLMLFARGFSGKAIGIEVQERAVKIARKNLDENKADSIDIVHSCIKEYVAKNSGKKFNVIYCNPPFFKNKETSNINDSEYKTIARHEKLITLEEIIVCAAKILENKGTFAIVHRASRFDEIIQLMRNNDIFPKRVQFVYSKEDSDEAQTVLIEGRFKMIPEVKVLKPLIAHKKDGSYTDDVEKMFRLENGND